MCPQTHPSKRMLLHPVIDVFLTAYNYNAYVNSSGDFTAKRRWRASGPVRFHYFSIKDCKAISQAVSVLSRRGPLFPAAPLIVLVSAGPGLETALFWEWLPRDHACAPSVLMLLTHLCSAFMSLTAVSVCVTLTGAECV